MADDFNDDRRDKPEDPFSREPIKTTYPGRPYIGGGPSPSRRFVLFGAVAAVSIIGGVISIFLAKGGKGGEPAESPAPGSQDVPAETPVVGEVEPRPAQTPREGLDAPDPARGHLGSASVTTDVLSVSGGGRDRERDRVGEGLKKTERGVVGAYMDYCRRRGVAEGRDEITIRFRITAAGAATDVEVLSNSTADGEMAAAAEEAAAAAQFPPTSEECFVTYRYILKARMAPATAGDR